MGDPTTCISQLLKALIRLCEASEMCARALCSGTEGVPSIIAVVAFKDVEGTLFAQESKLTDLHQNALKLLTSLVQSQGDEAAKRILAAKGMDAVVDLLNEQVVEMQVKREKTDHVPSSENVSNFLSALDLLCAMAEQSKRIRESLVRGADETSSPILLDTMVKFMGSPVSVTDAGTDETTSAEEKKESVGTYVDSDIALVCDLTPTAKERFLYAMAQLIVVDSARTRVFEQEHTPGLDSRIHTFAGTIQVLRRTFADIRAGKGDAELQTQICDHTLLLLHCLSSAALDHKLPTPSLNEAVFAAAESLLLPKVTLAEETRLHALCILNALAHEEQCALQILGVEGGNFAPTKQQEQCQKILAFLLQLIVDENSPDSTVPVHAAAQVLVQQLLSHPSCTAYLCQESKSGVIPALLSATLRHSSSSHSSPDVGGLLFCLLSLSQICRAPQGRAAINSSGRTAQLMQQLQGLMKRRRLAV